MEFFLGITVFILACALVIARIKYGEMKANNNWLSARVDQLELRLKPRLSYEDYMLVEAAVAFAEGRYPTFHRIPAGRTYEEDRPNGYFN